MAQEEFMLNMQSQIQSMDATTDYSLDGDKDQRVDKLIAGGREVLKLIEVNYTKRKMEIKLNLRRQGTKHAIGYLEFNKLNKKLFVAGSLQGTFSVWDIGGHGTQLTIVKEHTAAIHRMNWSPRNQNILISCGQDGLINVYDVNRPQNDCLVNQVIRSQKEAVRDVKFNPFFPDQFMAATDSGHLELYDLRNLSKYVAQRPTAHTNLIYCLDWSPKHANVFASGSTEKEIKVWSIYGSQHDIEERVKIQHIDGAAQIKWHSKNPSYLSVASLNRDMSITTYDINYPFRPQFVVKGQKDLFTSFTFDQDENYILTAQKDGILMLKSLDKCPNIYDSCPRYPVTFKQSTQFQNSQNNQIIYKLENPKPSEELLNNQPSLQKKQSAVSESFESEGLAHPIPQAYVARQTLSQASIPQNTFKIASRQIESLTGGGIGLKKQAESYILRKSPPPPVQPSLTERPYHQAQSSSLLVTNRSFHDNLFNSNKTVWNTRPVTVIKDFSIFTDESEKKGLTLDNEVRYLQLNYKLLKSPEQSATQNSDIAMKINKIEIGYIWKSFSNMIHDYENLAKDVEVKQIVKNPIQEQSVDGGEAKSPSGMPVNNSPMNFNQKSRGNSTEISRLQLTSQISQPMLSTQFSQITRKERQQPSQNLDLQRLYRYFEKYPLALKQEIEDKHIIISDNQLRIKKDRVPFYKDLLMAWMPINSLIDKDSMMQVLIKTFHDLIQLVIDKGELQSGYFMSLCIKQYQILPPEVVKIWTQSYIEFLMAYQFFSFTVKVAQDCPIAQIRQSNKFDYNQLCGNCNTVMEKASCSKCQYHILCSICALPVNGLLVWCQHCLHAGHAREYSLWFKTHEECPAGCGHKCFSDRHVLKL